MWWRLVVRFVWTQNLSPSFWSVQNPQPQDLSAVSRVCVCAQLCVFPPSDSSQSESINYLLFLTSFCITDLYPTSNKTVLCLEKSLSKHLLVNIWSYTHTHIHIPCLESSSWINWVFTLECINSKCINRSGDESLLSSLPVPPFPLSHIIKMF